MVACDGISNGQDKRTRLYIILNHGNGKNREAASDKCFVVVISLYSVVLSSPFRALIRSFRSSYQSNAKMFFSHQNAQHKNPLSEFQLI